MRKITASAPSLAPPAKPESTPHAGNEARLPSIGTHGLVHSESPAAIIGIRIRDEFLVHVGDDLCLGTAQLR